MFITLDNPANPLVWLRNHLPLGWLVRGAGAVLRGRHAVGKALRAELEQAGLERDLQRLLGTRTAGIDGGRCRLAAALGTGVLAAGFLKPAAELRAPGALANGPLTGHYVVVVARRKERQSAAWSGGDCSRPYLLQSSLQSLMRQGDHFAVVDAHHGFGGHQGVDDGLFGGLHGGLKQGRHGRVGQHRHLAGVLAFGDDAVGGGKGDKNIAGGITGHPAGAGDAHAYPPGDAFELVRQHRRVGGHHRDDAANVTERAAAFAARISRQVGNFLAHRHAGYGQLGAPAKVGLHQHAQRVFVVAQA